MTARTPGAICAHCIKHRVEQERSQRPVIPQILLLCFPWALIVAKTYGLPEVVPCCACLIARYNSFLVCITHYVHHRPDIKYCIIIS
jgi:hypothetical protein